MTQPGLGIDDVIKRLDSQELKKVRESFEKDVRDEDAAPGSVTPPPASARARVPREDVDEPMPPSDRYVAQERSKPAGPSAAARPRPPGSPPVQRQQTAVGLGSKTYPQKHTVADTGPVSRAPRTSISEETAGPAAPRAPRSTISETRGPSSRPPRTSITETKGPSSRPGRTTGNWSEEAPSGPRSRKPLTVDSVGDAATRIARTTRQTAPKVIATPQIIASAPLDSRTAFLLSLVDGMSDVPAIVDAAGMPADEVIAVLARLARLGLISVP